jgi:hypothetical protein
MSATALIANRVVDEFLEAIAAGHGLPESVYAPHAVLDATVPGWRLRRTGPADIVAEYARWFADPARFEELERRPVPGGEVVTYMLAWSEDGVPHAAHHCHILDIDAASGRIVHDTVFCGGRWNATLLAQMAEADG